MAITFGNRSVMPELRISWNPFTTYKIVIKSVVTGVRQYGFQEVWKRTGWFKEPLSSIGLNILLFVPLGYLIPSVFSFFHRWWRVLLAGLGFSLMIEVVQLATHLGWFDASDLFHNTLGAVIGYGGYWHWLRETTA